MLLSFHDFVYLSQPMDKTQVIWFAFHYTSEWDMDQSCGIENLHRYPVESNICSSLGKYRLGLVEDMM